VATPVATPDAGRGPAGVNEAEEPTGLLANAAAAVAAAAVAAALAKVGGRE